ncbi:MAG: sigma 54-interacting transcriptional regulator, partial [Candidatus Saganbacteria bacterium]|nr:sigma 54-interacting transcriptional regulator [Candidatus Saganbacteria bacterium]
VELIRNITNKALGRRELKEEGKKARAEGLREEIEGIIGSSGKIEEIANIIENISGKDMSILLAGEQGTEFELIAKAIHNKSERSSYPLRIIQIEKGGNDFTRSRILGSEQGSSTYTLEKEKGILEVAGAGTLLIKNVENLDTKLQEELADVLREKEIKKEGRSISIPFGARVICSTTSNLKELAASGKFSNKLFGLISESYLDLPPLRERSADIPIFVSYFLEKFNSKYNKEIKGVSKDATEILAGYPWPGNTEELRSVIENLVLTAKEEHIGADLLPIEILLNSSAFFAADEKNKVALEALWSDFEKDYIKNTLERTNFDENKAGTLLGLRSMALKAKLESLGLSKNL